MEVEKLRVFSSANRGTLTWLARHNWATHPLPLLVQHLMSRYVVCACVDMRIRLTSAVRDDREFTRY
jgi:hypothetical protein